MTSKLTTRIDKNPAKLIQGLLYHLFRVSLKRSNGSCIVLNDLSDKICIPNKKWHVNLNQN